MQTAAECIPCYDETLSQVAAPIFFLFTVKCPLVAAHIGSPTGTLVATKTAAWVVR
jgi:uncharacterized protein with ATP-grasp and redox domains